MKKMKHLILTNRYARAGLIVIGIFAFGFLGFKFLYPPFFESYTGVVNAELTYDSSVEVSDKDFEIIAEDLTFKTRMEMASKITADEKNEFTRNVNTQMLMETKSVKKESEYPHIKYFREAGIRQYKGPKTCLECHEDMEVITPSGELHTVNTLEDVVNTVHYKFQSTSSGFSTYGYDGREVNGEGTRAIPVGKIDRACGVPGSFSWTGWAELIETKPEHAHGETVIRSEGCGQCHIGGGYHPATEKMMPVGDVPNEAKEGIDCLICHSETYDMNYRYVIEDDNGMRWNQDRTLESALTVGLPKNENCLNCHQHNMGGDTYKYNIASQNLGYMNQRLLHEGSKRANPFSHEDDVHAAAGLQCTDCHVPQGHKIPRGTKGTDLVANDLPGVEVSCENCHTSSPHTIGINRAFLNGHVDRVACETCHITGLEETNAVLRDWVNPVWNEEEGVYTPRDILRSGEAGTGYTFLWFNGNGTFLANALGDNPLGGDLYDPFFENYEFFDSNELCNLLDPVLDELVRVNKINKVEYKRDLCNFLNELPADKIEERRKVVDEILRGLMQQGDSKIYPFKLFNAYMYEDMSNQGPFGAMILPFDYPTYYETGDPQEAVKEAIQNPIVKRMYEYPFKVYMMDEFMKYFGVSEWKTEYPLKNGELVNVEPHWMRQMGTLMFNHGIKKEGRQCVECHSESGVINFDLLGYPPERAAELRDLPEVRLLTEKNNK
ncbi:cytochrome c3 family protein [candidate division KSB1 bacterium]